MELHHHTTGAELLERSGDFLRQRETLHGMLLILAARAPDPKAPPYFATVRDERGVVLVALRTPPHNVVLSVLRDGAVAALDDLVADDLARLGHSLPGASGQADSVLAFATRWASGMGVGARVRLRFGAFELDRVVAPALPEGEFRLATEGEVPLLMEWTNRFVDETGLPEEDRPMASSHRLTSRVRAGMIHVWSVDGAPVTMAVGHLGGVARIGGVYTPADFRRHGYASACVARLSQKLLDGGARTVTLSADDANPTSNKIYTAMGYRRVGDEAMVSFEPRPA